MIFGAIILGTVCWKRVRLTGDAMVRLCLFVASSYLLFSGLGIENQALTDQDLDLVFDVAVKLGVVGMSAYGISVWFGPPSSGVLSRSIAVVLCVGMVGPGALSHLYHTYIVSVAPESGHEYVDNRAVADALLHIPLDGTLLATNDLRYPANDYRRDQRQFQLAGVFGHRNMASNLAYTNNFSEEQTAPYHRANQLFQLQTWPAVEIARLRREVPLTHLLIHKSYAHGDDIPLWMIYENQEYAVYMF